VLADLCSRCADQADRILELYGGRGRHAMRITPGGLISRETDLLQRVGGAAARSLLYVLLVVATFFVVTFVASRR
jgi:hypothetical protein